VLPFGTRHERRHFGDFFLKTRYNFRPTKKPKKTRSSAAAPRDRQASCLNSDELATVKTGLRRFQPNTPTRSAWQGGHLRLQPPGRPEEHGKPTPAAAAAFAPAAIPASSTRTRPRPRGAANVKINQDCLPSRAGSTDQRCRDRPTTSVAMSTWRRLRLRLPPGQPAFRGQRKADPTALLNPMGNPAPPGGRPAPRSRSSKSRHDPRRDRPPARMVYTDAGTGVTLGANTASSTLAARQTGGLPATGRFSGTFDVVEDNARRNASQISFRCAARRRRAGRSTPRTTRSLPTTPAYHRARQPPLSSASTRPSLNTSTATPRRCSGDALRRHFRQPLRVYVNCDFNVTARNFRARQSSAAAVVRRAQIGPDHSPPRTPSDGRRAQQAPKYGFGVSGDISTLGYDTRQKTPTTTAASPTRPRRY